MEAKTTRRPNVFPLILLLLAVAAFATIRVTQMVISKHAMTAHQGEMYSALDVYGLIDRTVASGNNNGGGPCIKLEISSCMEAVNIRGEPSPQAKVACLIRGTPENGLWAVGIVGLWWGEDFPVYATGHVEHTAALEHERKRDKCVTGDLTWLSKWFGPNASNPPAMPMNP